MRGGLTELRRIAAIAEIHGIKIAPHLFPELMSYLLASIPNASWLEYMGWHGRSVHATGASRSGDHPTPDGSWTRADLQARTIHGVSANSVTIAPEPLTASTSCARAANTSGTMRPAKITSVATASRPSVKLIPHKSKA